MKFAIFRDEPFRSTDKYGLYSLVRETPSRWYFEHHMGDVLPRSAFGYHNTHWISKQKAGLILAWIEDTSTFEAIVTAHRDKTEAIMAINLRAHDDREHVTETWIETIIKLGAGGPPA